MNLKKINKAYKARFHCNTDVQWECNELNIYIGDRHSVFVEDIKKADAYILAKDLLNKWGFSFFLEFKGYADANKFLTT